MKINGEKVKDFDEFVKPYGRYFKVWRWFNIKFKDRDFITRVIKYGRLPWENYEALIEVDGVMYGALPCTTRLRHYKTIKRFDVDDIFELEIRTDD
jgi:hypothetical protein